MRCPKCSYTSFDHLVTCEKCGRDLTELVDQLHGTSLKVESPLFLGTALDAPVGEEMFDTDGGTSIPDLAMDEEGDSFMSLKEEVAEAADAEEAAPIVEQDTAVEAPEPPPVEQPTAEEPDPAAESAEEEEERISLDFEGLDLSDLTPADDSGLKVEGAAAAESPLDLWALDSSADEDLSDLFDDLVPAGKRPSEKTTQTKEPPTSETAEGDKPKKDDTQQ